jgi:hypothetical protein
VPWESFRAEVEAVVLTSDELKKSSAGRKPFDARMVKKLKLSKRGELSIPGIASPGGAGYDFLSKQSRIGWPWRTNGLGAYPGLRHGDDGPGTAGAE